MFTRLLPVLLAATIALVPGSPAPGPAASRQAGGYAVRDHALYRQARACGVRDLGRSGIHSAQSMAQTGRKAAVDFLEPFLLSTRISIIQSSASSPTANLVAVHSHGVFAAGDPGIAVVDILRVEGCKVVEHWDVVQPVAGKSANATACSEHARLSLCFLTFVSLTYK